MEIHAAIGGGREVLMPGASCCTWVAEQLSSHHLVQWLLRWNSVTCGTEAANKYGDGGQHLTDELSCSHTTTNPWLPKRTFFQKTSFLPYLKHEGCSLCWAKESTQQGDFDNALQNQSISLLLRTTLTRTKQLWAAIDRVVGDWAQGHIWWLLVTSTLFSIVSVITSPLSDTFDSVKST